MAGDEISTILRKTLEDFRVSRGEKRVLESILQQVDADDHRLAVLRSQAFDIARAELLSPQAKGVVDWLEDVVKLLQPKPQDDAKEEPARAFFSPGGECSRRIISLLGSARRAADICVFSRVFEELWRKLA